MAVWPVVGIHPAANVERGAQSLDLYIYHAYFVELYLSQIKWRCFAKVGLGFQPFAMTTAMTMAMAVFVSKIPCFRRNITYTTHLETKLVDCTFLHVSSIIGDEKESKNPDASFLFSSQHPGTEHYGVNPIAQSSCLHDSNHE